MALALRFVKSYVIWDFSPNEIDWLGKNEIPADPLGDLKTMENTLSIYILGDDLSDLDRCISAWAAKKCSLEEINYILFDEKIILNTGIKYKQVNNGLLPDDKANELHYDMYELSSQKLVALATSILGNCVPDIKDRIVVSQLLNASIEKGWIDIDMLNKGIKKHINISND